MYFASIIQNQGCHRRIHHLTRSMAEHLVNEMVSMHKNSFAVLSLLKQAILSISRGPRKPDTVHGYQIIFPETYQE